MVAIRGDADRIWRFIFLSRPNTTAGLQSAFQSTAMSLRQLSAQEAAAIRLFVLENQCTGYAGYAGEQDNDPVNNTDCKTASDRGTIGAWQR